MERPKVTELAHGMARMESQRIRLFWCSLDSQMPRPEEGSS